MGKGANNNLIPSNQRSEEELRTNPENDPKTDDQSQTQRQATQHFKRQDDKLSMNTVKALRNKTRGYFFDCKEIHA